MKKYKLRITLLFVLIIVLFITMNFLSPINNGIFNIQNILIVGLEESIIFFLIINLLYTLFNISYKNIRSTVTTIIFFILYILRINKELNFTLFLILIFLSCSISFIIKFGNNQLSNS